MLPYLKRALSGKRYIAILLFALAGGLTSCSSTNQAYYDSIRIAMSSNDALLSIDDVRTRKADLLQVKHGERDIAVMALAFIENERYKWISADHALLIMHHGVVTETQGFGKDLLYVSDLRANPLAQPEKLAFRWEYAVDLNSVGYGLPVTSEWRMEEEQTLSVFDQSIQTIRVTQSVTFPRSTPYWEAGLSWQNQYWFDKQSRALIRSRQKLSPQGEWLDMVYLSRAARLLEQGGEHEIHE